jgi:hypothetical protein
MTKDEAFELMRCLLRELLIDAEKLAKQAKNPAARRAAHDRATRIRNALSAADDAT